MTSISEVEHAPESCIRVGFRDLEEGEVGGVGRWKGEFVYGGYDTCVCNRPLEITGSFTANDTGRGR